MTENKFGARVRYPALKEEKSTNFQQIGGPVTVAQPMLKSTLARRGFGDEAIELLVGDELKGAKTSTKTWF